MYRCDGGAKVNMPRPSLIEPLANPLSSNTRASSPASEPEDPLSASTSSLLQSTRLESVQQDHAPMTPPTPQFSHPPSPATTHGSLQPDPVEAAARRARTDHASRLIGQKLLQGWTLLGDECTQPGCLGVPLMRRPRVVVSEQGIDTTSTPAAKVLDPRKHCVNCLRDYLMEQDVKAYDDFLRRTGAGQVTASTSKLPTQQTPSTAALQDIEHGATAKKRRFSTQPARSKMTSSIAKTPGASAIGDARPQTPQAAPLAPKVVTPQATEHQNQATEPEHTSHHYKRAIESLTLAVKTLSDRLDACCNGSLPATHDGIAEHAEALARACKALKETSALYNH